MEKKIYHIKPIYKSFVWAGEKLKEYFKLDIPQEKVGTIYHVISIKGDLDNIVEEVALPLSSFYEKNRDLFGCSSEEFPIRMTSTCNEGFQSFQVHPDDTYAFEHDNKAKGKVSGALVLNESNEIKRKKYGHKVKNLDEFKECVEKKDWDKLFNYLDVKDGDFVHTPAGVIHGGYGDGKITSTFGTNGDLTYRFYDLDRNDPKRPLRIEDVYNLQKFPDTPVTYVHPVAEKINGCNVYNLYDKEKEYIAKRIKIESKGTFEFKNFLFIACVNGEGSINGVDIKLGETLFVPTNFGQLNIEGNDLDLICISYREE